MCGCFLASRDNCYWWTGQGWLGGLWYANGKLTRLAKRGDLLPTPVQYLPLWIFQECQKHSCTSSHHSKNTTVPPHTIPKTQLYLLTPFQKHCHTSSHRSKNTTVPPHTIPKTQLYLGTSSHHSKNTVVPPHTIPKTVPPHFELR